MNLYEADIIELKNLSNQLDNEDIPGLGKALNHLELIEKTAKMNGDAEIVEQALSLKTYVEKLVLFETSDLNPFKNGVRNLSRTIGMSIDELEGYTEDSQVGQNNGSLKPYVENGSGADGFFEEKDNMSFDSDLETVEEIDQKPDKLSEIDKEILRDFVIESRENLERIEVNLIELEQSPDNKDTINAIFRPFHTIKGVSGFLNLNKINKLSHTTENLLDSARKGELRITDDVVDVILSSIDKLNQLISYVQKSLDLGKADLEGEIDITGLVFRIETLSDNLRKNLVSQPPLKPSVENLFRFRDPEDLYAIDADDKGQWKSSELAIEIKDTVSKTGRSTGGVDKRGSRTALQVKVDTLKLDNLIDQTGELVIAQAMLRQSRTIMGIKDQKVLQTFSRLTQIISDLQRTAMSMRMVPIKSTFQKMVRLVRDLSRTSKKEVNLKMIGEDTEIDRNVVDELYEPLVHMIRNAVDHGLETPSERNDMGKSPKGSIYLRAYHKGGNFVIEIEDDGKGLNKDKIIEKAIKSELIDSDARLLENEIYNLIFLPGFSTAAKITDVSGRGVGMDVVKKGIEKFRGKLDIQSKLGKGTKFIISLPLTLAIIEGMLVRVGKERYIVPTMSIIESFKPKVNECFTVEGKGEMVSVRGGLIPIIRLDRICGVEGDAKNPWDGLILVVENKNEKRGLLLDELLGQEEIVIKSLGEALNKIKGLAGGAILGDGKVGLILDMDGLFEISNR